jgi:GntR family transcriptional regulator, N-acetylglucosamine utilization regulator
MNLCAWAVPDCSILACGQPVVDLNRWVWADDETLFEYTHIVANGALHEFTYTYELDEEAST